MKKKKRIAALIVVYQGSKTFKYFFGKMHTPFTWGTQKRPLSLHSTASFKCSQLVRAHIIVQAAAEMCAWKWPCVTMRAEWGESLSGCQGREWSDRSWDEGSSSQTVGRQRQGQGALLAKSQFLFPKAGSWGKANHLAPCQSHKNPFLPAWIQRNKHSFTIHSAVLLNPVCFCIRIDVCCIYWNPVNLLFPSLYDLLLLLLSKCIQCPLWLGFNHPSG